MERRERLVGRLFELAWSSWLESEKARRTNDMAKARTAFDDAVKFFSILYICGFDGEVEKFLRDNKMPARVILNKIKEKDK